MAFNCYGPEECQPFDKNRHTMGAAVAFETIACCLAIDKNEIPLTINFEEKYSDCDINCVPNRDIFHQIKIYK